MINATSTSRPAAVAAAGPEQLSLLPSATTPARFRLSRDTRERGLRHVAEIRAMLAAKPSVTTSAAAPGGEIAPFDPTFDTANEGHDRAA